MKGNEVKKANTSETVTIACIGECMVELSPVHTPDNRSASQRIYQQAFAGDTLNTAVYLSRLLQSTPVSVQYVTAVGNDNLSQSMIKFWKQEGINCQHVVRIEGKALGLYMIQTNDTGERSFSYWRKHSAASALLSDKGLNSLSIQQLTTEINYLYFSGISLAILDSEAQNHLLNLLTVAKQNGATIVFDSNYRPHLWSTTEESKEVFHKAMGIADIALLTFEDEARLFGDSHYEETIRRYASTEELIIKRGSEGCVIKQVDTMTHVPSVFVNAVMDTTAAGDSFNAGYLAARLSGQHIDESARFAHKLAATVIQHQGAIIPSSSTTSFTQEILSLWTA